MDWNEVPPNNQLRHIFHEVIYSLILIVDYIGHKKTSDKINNDIFLESPYKLNSFNFVVVLGTRKDVLLISQIRETKMEKEEWRIPHLKKRKKEKCTPNSKLQPMRQIKKVSHAPCIAATAIAQPFPLYTFPKTFYFICFYSTQFFTKKKEKKRKFACLFVCLIDWLKYVDDVMA